MNKYLVLLATFAMVGAASNVTAKMTTAQKESLAERFRHHRQLSHAEKVAKAEETASEWREVAAAIDTTTLAKRNPAAYKRVQKALSRAETRLSNLKSGKRGHYKKRYSPEEVRKKSEAFKKRVAKAAPVKAEAEHKKTLMEKMFGSDND